MATENGGRVTTQEFYTALLKQADNRMEMERRIITRLDSIIEAQNDFSKVTLASITECGVKQQAANDRIKANEEAIKTLGKWDKGIVVVSTIFSTIAGIIGFDN